MQERIEGDARRLLSVIEQQRLAEFGFSNASVDGPNRSENVHPYLIAGIYPADPTYRAWGLSAQAETLTPLQRREKILGFKVQADYIKEHRRILESVNMACPEPGSEEDAAQYLAANIRAIQTGLPIVFFLFSQFESDGGNAAHMYFPTHLMPDNVLEKVQSVVRGLNSARQNP